MAAKPAAADAPARGEKARAWLPAALWVMLGLLPTLLVTLGRNLNPDEHQFIAAGALLAREGLLPYRDFAYFHVPNLAFIYAALFSVADHLLLSARLFSLGCATLLLQTMLLFSRRRWMVERAPAPAWSEAEAVLLFGLSPLFVYTSGSAWNHDLPVLLSVWATLALVYGMRRTSNWRWLLVAGLLAGFAAGTRSSFVFLLVPLAAAAAVGPGEAGGARGGAKRALLRLLAFGAGVAIGLLPVVYTVAQAPAAFIFGNVEYVRLNTAFRVTEGYATAMTLPGKMARLAGVMVLPGNLLVLVAYLAFGLPRAGHWRSWPTHLRPVVLVMLPFLLAGALVPTPAWPQYFYVLMPFLWLAALDGLAARPPRWLGTRTSRRALVVVLLVLLALWGITNRRDLRDTFKGRWIPIVYHRAGVEIADLLGAQSRILTLAPTLPLEGGLLIYPELTTGPFALRAASMASSEQRIANDLVPVDALEGWLVGRPPRALLLSVDRNDFADEQALFDYVAAPGFVPLPLRDKSTLWANSLATWDDNIRLAALTRTPSDSLMPGQTLSLLNYLQAQQPTATNLSRIVRLRSADGTPAGSVATQISGWPWGQPTTKWEAGALWYDGAQITLPADAAPGLYRLEVELYDADADQSLPLTLGMGRYANGSAYGEYVSVGEWPGAPETPLRPTTEIGGFAHLLGYTLDAQSADALALRLFWQGDGPADGDYTVFAQMLDGAGVPIAQHDKLPLDGFYPTSAWSPGLAFADDFVLPLPSPLPPGPYTLLVGMYDPVSGARQPITQAGRPAGDTVTIPVNLER